MSNPTLYYWPIKARNYHLQAVAQAGGVNLTLKSDFDFAELKSELPFGQVPYLVDGDIKLAQSNAIFRYLSKKGNQQGDSDAAFAASEQFTEEANDLYNLLAKAYYVTDRTAGLNELFSPEGGVAKQLAFLEKLHPGDGPFFGGPKRVAGAYALAAILDILTVLEPSVLDNFPKMKSFYTAMLALPAFDGLRDMPMYFKRE